MLKNEMPNSVMMTEKTKVKLAFQFNFERWADNTKMTDLPVKNPHVPYTGKISNEFRSGSTIKVKGIITDHNGRWDLMHH